MSSDNQASEPARWPALAEQLVGRIVVKTDRGVGCHADIGEEVVLMGVAFFAEGLVKSNDASKPWCYHASRDALLDMARDLCDKGHLNIFGMDGPAVKLAIPGIGFPMGADLTGDQTQDAGGHVSIYVRSPEAATGAPYTPPDLTAAKQLVGHEYTFTLLPPEQGLQILVANESNDMKTGLCYYLAVTFDKASTAQANVIKALVGLAADTTQTFHISIAGLAPAWQPVHPKSLLYRAADNEQKRKMALEEDFQVFRKGSDGFLGFNADAVTGWTTYALRAAAMGKESGCLGKALAELAKEPKTEEHNEAVAKLTAKKKSIIKTLGFPRCVTMEHNKSDAISAEMLKRALPSIASQQEIMTAFTIRKRIKVGDSRVEASHSHASQGLVVVVVVVVLAVVAKWLY